MSAVINIRRQNKMMRAYRAAGATEPQSACTPEELGLRNSWLFGRMINRGVFVPIADGRYFMDEEAARDFVRRRAIRIAIWMGVVLVIWVMMQAAT